jgi:hypothetical protein
MRIVEIIPTVFLRQGASALEQQLKIKIENSSDAVSGMLTVNIEAIKYEQTAHIIVPPGESAHNIFIPELDKSVALTAVLKVANMISASLEAVVHPPKHWRVHVVQLSHHDLGYTGLPSNVLSKYVRYLDQAVDMAEATADYPHDAKFRITLEQQWALGEFLRVAPPGRVDKIIKLMQEGRFELTALFGNMITELCGHESLIRAFYPSYRLKKKYGIPIISAEHNDITGVSWGLCRLLTDLDIKIFCPGFPLYYFWSEGVQYQSFWNQEKMFGYADAPGAFWWEAATGKRLLCWCNNHGCGGSADPALPELEETLEQLEKKDYRSSIFRWPVQGGYRDNSPYIADFADTVRKWNETWVFPHLICSTNAMFYHDFADKLPDNLPVHRGELPGQDYPPGATSAAKATAINRNNHQTLLSAEKTATIASLTTNYQYQGYELEQAYENTLRFEEHAFGHTFSEGMAMDGAEAEKAVNSAGAAAFAHDVLKKSLAEIADSTEKEDDGFYLLVFNMLSRERSGILKVPLRELENSEIIMERHDGTLAAAALHGRQERTHLPLKEFLVEGKFELIDADTGETVPCQLNEILPEDPVPYAAQRAGLARGRDNYFNHPSGLNLDICFNAENVPAVGYKTYRFKAAPANIKASRKRLAKQKSHVIENEFYQINVAGNLEISIFDKKSGKELVDKHAPHKLGDVIVKNPVDDSEKTAVFYGNAEICRGNICATIKRKCSVAGHPLILQSITLYEGSRRIDFDIRLLKDSTPLLDVHVAFPFAVENPEFTYEGTLNALRPVEDFLPEAYSDRLSVQNWVRVRDKSLQGNGILWSAHDAPLVSLSELWHGYISPAHSCVQSPMLAHPPQLQEDLRNGWIYSNIFNNNFCTNFSVTQSGEYLFRYSFILLDDCSDSDVVYMGMQLLTPLESSLTCSDYQGQLPLKQSFISIANKDIILLNCKRAENEKGVVLRIWNPGLEKIESEIACMFPFANACVATHTEERTRYLLPVKNNSFTVSIAPHDMMTILLTEE